MVCSLCVCGSHRPIFAGLLWIGERPSQVGYCRIDVWFYSIGWAYVWPSQVVVLGFELDGGLVGMYVWPLQARGVVKCVCV